MTNPMAAKQMITLRYDMSGRTISGKVKLIARPGFEGRSTLESFAGSSILIVYSSKQKRRQKEMINNIIGLEQESR